MVLQVAPNGPGTAALAATILKQRSIRLHRPRAFDQVTGMAWVGLEGVAQGPSAPDLPRLSGEGRRRLLRPPPRSPDEGPGVHFYDKISPP